VPSTISAPPAKPSHLGLDIIGPAAKRPHNERRSDYLTDKNYLNESHEPTTEASPRDTPTAICKKSWKTKQTRSPTVSALACVPASMQSARTGDRDRPQTFARKSPIHPRDRA